MFLLAMPQPGPYHKTEEYSDPGYSLYKTAKFDRKMMEMKCLIKKQGDQIAMKKGPKISTKEKRRGEEANPKGPAISQRHHCLIWGEFFNVFFGSTSKNILPFCSLRPI